MTYTASGFQFSDTAATVLTGSLARAPGETVAASPYAISQGTLAANSNYTIHFTGDSLSITPATPTVTVNALAGTYTGAPIAATATVTGVNGTAAASLEGVTPTLTYYAGSGTAGTDLGAVAPSGVGTYTVVASFPGSADYAPAQSAAATFVIAPVITRSTATIALTSSASTAVYGQAVTFVATVSSSAGTTGGAVTFFDGTAPLATVALNGSGQATLTVTSLAPGSHAITATYNGAAGTPATSSSATTESVGQAATAIVLAPHAVLKGKKTLKAIELTAEIEPVAPGGGVPTGQVTFEFVTKHRKKTQVKTLGTAAIRGGAATMTFKPTALLNKPLTVVYSGDPDFAASMMTTPKLTKFWDRKFQDLTGGQTANGETAAKRGCLRALGNSLPEDGTMNCKRDRLRKSIRREGQREPRPLGSPAERSRRRPRKGFRRPRTRHFLGGSRGSKRTNFFWASTHSGRSPRTAATSLPHPSPKSKATAREANRMAQVGFCSVRAKWPSARTSMPSASRTKSGLSNDQLRQFLNFPVPEVNPNTKKIVYPYVRLNGLDSQSCWECHNFIGTERLPDTRSLCALAQTEPEWRRGGIRRQRVH